LRHGPGGCFEEIDDERLEPVSRPFMNPGPGLLFGASTRRVVAGGAVANVDGRTQRRQRLEGNRLVRIFVSHRVGTGLVWNPVLEVRMVCDVHPPKLSLRPHYLQEKTLNQSKE
jgi:hypothetical protein